MRIIRQFVFSILFASGLAWAFLASAPPVHAATTCANLTDFSIEDGMITSAVEITAPFQTAASSGTTQITVSAPFAFCKVTATLTPTSDSAISMELWMPKPGYWNHKFLGVGNGALTGAIWHTSMVRPLQAGYAVANSDLGHPISTANWALGHPEKVIDYAHRGDHVTALASKAIINEFYGLGPRLSYFHGCSNGGHQALMEAQRYPDDYDGIIAGAPWNQWTHQNVEFISRALALEQIDATKLPMITAAVIAQCGGRDGGLQSDKYLNKPQQCNFRPQSLRCSSGNAPNCLTPSEVAAVNRIYYGPVNPTTGLRLFPGFERGSEFGWVGFGAFINNLWQYMIKEDLSFDFHNFDFNSDVAFFDAKLAATINSNNPDLSAFRARGGKLLMWHGWTDTTLEPRSSLNYYNSVVAVTGSGVDVNLMRNNSVLRGRLFNRREQYLEETQEYFRLFMAPGVNHCGGGLGPNSSFAYTLANTAGPLDANHDILAALDRWVRTDRAPDRLIASHFTSGIADRTRPVCAYPSTARYIGTGDPDIPQSWRCTVDSAQFDDDYAQELRNIVTDVRSGNLDNLPN